MSTDRSIHLDISLANLGARMGEDLGKRQGMPREPDEQARRQFEQALAGAGDAAARSADAGADAPRMPQPFELFARTHAHPQQARPRLEGLEQALEGLMVGEGGGGGRQVRMELKEDLLPGVTVTLQELEGHLQIDFFCALESSRLRLNEAAFDETAGMARRLRRDVLMRVQTDDEDDPRLYEVLAKA